MIGICPVVLNGSHLSGDIVYAVCKNGVLPDDIKFHGIIFEKSNKTYQDAFPIYEYKDPRL